MEIKIKNKKITTIGTSCGFVVPAHLFKDGTLDKAQRYDIIIVAR